MAVKKTKRKRGLIRIISTAKTGTFYVVNGSKGKKIKKMKYDRKIRRRVMFEEHKMA
ncbi:50S ribosomal protein L33 [Lyticum sinuosum]|uniref:Large ribosomal subunit protein bL33 n=1 Tax=Lyticum sinuosum TaxID=1332059 RepID=A0AAE4VLB4_9RICK|nr:50S ribosomal protein L33 [Lyticum sinuosum]MDZ5761633.1 50S ribosomal protein L33 [Lyticum sinuosum]